MRDARIDGNRYFNGCSLATTPGGLSYSYDEICQLTGFSYTAVNRYITEGRRALRRGGYTPQEQARHPDIAGARGENAPASS
ncbi:MAG: hypothetical protein ACRDPC_24900 [Solirubrobacteraceae bacterium]